MVPVSGGIVAVRNKKIMKRFKAAGAIGPANAVAAEDVGLRDNFVLNRFVRLGLLAREGDRLYIPESFTQTRRWKMMFGRDA